MTSEEALRTLTTHGVVLLDTANAVIVITSTIGIGFYLWMCISLQRIASKIR